MAIKVTRSSALKFILLVGIVNLFADFTYEGARSIIGPFLGSLGASALALNLTVGLGEFVGYALRSVSGYIADKTHRYWLTAFIGYFINMFAVPALALAGNWPLAAALIVAERTGRAIRRPAVEAMLSYQSKEIGSGKVFGLNEALDQAGATFGPLIVALVLYLRGGFREGFAVLLISALLCVVTLFLARFLYPQPGELSAPETQITKPKGFSKSFWLLTLAGVLIAAGAMDFSFIAFHLHRVNLISTHFIPLIYSLAMAASAITALVFGRLYDRIGITSVIIAFFLGALSIPLSFLGNLPLVILGIVLWGVGIGAQDSLLKAILVPVVEIARRASAFGIFDGLFGFAWLLGNLPVGLLYERSLVVMVLFSITLQLSALPIFYFVEKKSKT